MQHLLKSDESFNSAKIDRRKLLIDTRLKKRLEASSIQQSAETSERAGQLVIEESVRSDQAMIDEDGDDELRPATAKSTPKFHLELGDFPPPSHHDSELSTDRSHVNYDSKISIHTNEQMSPSHRSQTFDFGDRIASMSNRQSFAFQLNQESTMNEIMRQEFATEFGFPPRLTITNDFGTIDIPLAFTKQEFITAPTTKAASASTPWNPYVSVGPNPTLAELQHQYHFGLAHPFQQQQSVTTLHMCGYTIWIEPDVHEDRFFS